jgi:membrane protease YdiL (CAAX protease family)
MFALGSALGTCLASIYLRLRDASLSELTVPRWTTEKLRWYWLAAGLLIAPAGVVCNLIASGISISQQLSLSGFVSYLVAVTIQPIAEEFIFRLLLLGILIRFFIDIRLAVIIQAIAFALIHAELGILGQLAAFVSAVSFALSIMAYRSVWIPIALHMSLNISEMFRGLALGMTFSGDLINAKITLEELLVPGLTAAVLLAWSVAGFLQSGLQRTSDRYSE